ncbi:MAG: hypothetical protein M1836_005275 [Candelina mexicana]|nr:MAG: hypothetical protein M1836_005275 [Candelina mexicana]
MPSRNSDLPSNRWPPMLAVRGSSRGGSIQNPTTTQEASAPPVSERTTSYRHEAKMEKSQRARKDWKVSRSAPAPKYVDRAEHLSPNPYGVPQVFATIICGPSQRPSLRRVKGKARLQNPQPSTLPKPFTSRDSAPSIKPTADGVFHPLSFRERMRAVNHVEFGLYVPDVPRSITDNDQNGGRLSSPEQSTAHAVASHLSTADHPCGDLITTSMLSRILHYHPTREMLRTSLARTGNERLIDSWLGLKAQKAAQAYADAPLSGFEKGYNNVLSSGHQSRFLELEKSLLDRLLQGLPGLFTGIVDAWLQSTSIRIALELRAADVGSIAHSDSLFTDGRNVRRTIPNLLRSFCISDPNAEGNPINVTSKDVMPRESIHEDELLYLNLPANVEEYSTLTAAHDEHGNPIYSFIFSTPLQNETGKTVHILTSQIDISYFVQQHVSKTLSGQGTDGANEKPGLDLAIKYGTAKDEGSLEMLTTAIHLDDAYRRGPTVQPQQVRPANPTAADAATSSVSLVDWMEIALEESLKSCADPAEVNRSFNKLEDCTDVPELIKQIKMFYKEHFILAPSERPGMYEVMCLSPSLCTTEQFFNDPFKYTPSETSRWILAELNKEQSFAVRIKWGETRVDKWLYCTPMLGPEVDCWVCILIDGDVPNIWED